MRAAGEKMVKDYQQRKQDLEKEKDDILSRVRQEADSQRHAIMKEAREEAAAYKSRFHEEFEQHKRQLREQLQGDIIAHSCRLAETLLRELAGTTLDDQAISQLVKRLDAAKDDEAHKFKQHLSGDMLITTAHPLSSATKKRLENALATIMEPQCPQLTFDVSEKLLFGAVIQGETARLEWNAGDYLRQVEDDAYQALLEEKGRATAGDDHA